jgi:hypothetical protein
MQSVALRIRKVGQNAVVTLLHDIRKLVGWVEISLIPLRDGGREELLLEFDG